VTLSRLWWNGHCKAPSRGNYHSCNCPEDIIWTPPDSEDTL